MKVDWWPGAVFVATLLIYSALAPRVEARLDPVTGDEPFYMMTAHNILAGRGLDETQTWAQRDYLTEFYPAIPLHVGWQGWKAFSIDVPPHDSKGTIPPGLYSKHGLGLSLLILPWYALGKRAAIVLFLNMLGALVATNVFLLAFEVSRRRGIACFICAALALSCPLMPYAYLIFPEIPAALCVIYALRRARSEVNNAWQTLATGLCIATLPWLHARFGVLALTLFCFWFWRHFWQAPRLSPASVLPLLPPVISAAFLLDFYFYLYGTFLPNAQDHGGVSGVLGTANGAAGLLLDQQWGLLPAAPLYLLALAAALANIRRSGWSLAIVGPYLLLIANYAVWWGEWCPPARYLTAVLPLLAAPLARVRFGLLVFLGVPLALLSWALMSVFVYDPQLMYNQPTGYSQVFSWLSAVVNFDITAWLPSFVVPTSPPALVLAWLCGLVALLLGLTFAVAFLRRSQAGAAEGLAAVHSGFAPEGLAV